MRDTVIFDLDGTLADIRHRLHFIQSEKKEWDSFFSACMDDTPIWQTIKMCNFLASDHRVIIASGRSDAVRLLTERWLRAHDVAYHELIMRTRGDHRPDEKLKQEWIGTLINPEKVWCVFDDRKRVVEMWRRNGLMCYQVAEGEY